MRQVRSALVYALLFAAPKLGLRAADGAWISLAPMSDPRQEVAVAELGGKIYVVGGLPSTNPVQEYNPASNSWRFVAPLPIATDHAAAASAGGSLYVMGGNAGGGQTSALFQYDPARDQWTQRMSMPTGRAGLAAAAIGGKIYAVGGYGGSERELEVYDPSTNTWTRRAPMPTGRNHTAAGAVGGKLYVAGGRFGGGGGPGLDALEVYDPATDSWAALAPMPTARSGHAAAVVGDKLYTFGGEGNPNSPIGIFKEAEVYDSRAGTWKSLDPLPTPRHGVGAAAVGNRIHVLAGATAAGAGTHTGVNEVFVVQSERLAFAHFAAGRGINAELILANGAETQAAVASVELWDPEGKPLEVVLEGSVRSKIVVAVPASGSVALRATDSGSALRTGWLSVSSESPLGGLIFLADRVSGIGSTPPSVNLFFPVQRDATSGLFCAVALANVADQPAIVNLILRTVSGAELGRRRLTIPAGGQIAEVIERLFPDVDISRANFRGTVSVASTAAVAALPLLFKGDNFTALPVSGF